MSTAPRDNYYIALGLRLDPPEDSWPVIEAEILKRQTEWSQRCSRAGPVGRKATRHLSQLGDMKAVLSDERARRAEAQAAIEFCDRARQQLRAELDSVLEVLSAKKRIAAAELAALHTQFSEHPPEYCRLTPVEIRKRIRVPVEPDPAAASPPPAPLEPTTAAEIRELLDDIGEKNLYDFLGLKASSTEPTLHQRAVAVYRENQLITKKTPQVTAKSKLAGHCSVIFKTPAGRQSYDAVLRSEKLRPLEPHILVPGAKGVIEVAEYDMLVVKAVSWGATKSEAEAYIASKIQKKSWKVQVPVQFSVDVQVRCHCGHLNPREDSHCGHCGHVLGSIACPGPECGKPQPGTQGACSECGFPLGDMPNALPLIAKARLALHRDHNLEEAERCLRQANAFWPGHPESQRLQQALQLETARPWIAKARHALQTDRNAREAERLLLEAQRACPGHPDVATLKSQIRDEGDRIHLAAQALQSAVSSRKLSEIPKLFDDLRHWASNHPGLRDAQSIIADLDAAQAWQRQILSAIRAREAPAPRSITAEQSILTELDQGVAHLEYLTEKERHGLEQRRRKARTLLDQFDRWQQALASGSDKELVDAWDSGDLLPTIEEAHREAGRIAAARKRLQVTLDFHKACQAGNEPEIVRVFQSSPSLQDRAVADSPGEGQLTIRQRAELAERRVATVEELRLLIHRQDEHEKRYKNLDPDLEPEIAKRYQESCANGGPLAGSRYAEQHVAARARTAQSRLAAFQRLQSAHRAGQKAAFRDEAGQSCSLLANYPPARSLLDEFTRWKAVQAALADVRAAQATDRTKDERLVALWEKHAVLHDSGLQSDPDWVSGKRLVDEARTRIGIRRTIEQAMAREPMDFAAIAACWDEPLFAGDPQVAPWRPSIQTALSLSRLDQAIRNDSDETIRRAWEPERVAETPYVKANAERIRRAVLVHELSKPPFRADDPALEFDDESHQLAVSWQWVDSQIAECALAVDDGQFPPLQPGKPPTAAHLIQRSEFLHAKGARSIAFQGRFPHVIIAPVVKFLNERYLAGPFLRLSLATITYRVRRSPWRWLRPSSRSEVLVRSQSGRVRLGPIVVTGQEIGADPGSAKELGRLAEGWLDGRRPARIPFDTSAFPREAEIEILVRPLAKANAEAIRVLLPAPEKRTVTS